MMKWLAGLFLLFLIAVVIAVDRGHLPGFLYTLYSFPGGDKVGHFFLMGILGFLVEMALVERFTAQATRSVLIGSLVVAIVVGSEEYSQQFFVSRSASWADLASSYAGIVCFTCLALQVNRWRREQSQLDL